MKGYSIWVSRLLLSVFVIAALLAPTPLWACACGCGVFQVGTGSMLPTQPGGLASFEMDYMNQDKDWSGAHRGSDDNNNDKQIRTEFFTAEIQYMFNRKWGFMAELPYTDRYFKTTDGMGDFGEFNHAAVGDIRLEGIYSGFSPDMSSGLIFGLRLPTGDYTYANFDSDTEIGSGSTDILLGGYHMGRIPGLKSWNWYVNTMIDAPAIAVTGYRPGSELDTALGTYYTRWSVGGVRIAPVAQVIDSLRLHDSGMYADFTDSGYHRIMLSPGVEFHAKAVRVYTDAEFPVFQSMNGNQLVASVLLKLNIGYAF